MDDRSINMEALFELINEIPDEKEFIITVDMRDFYE